MERFLFQRIESTYLGLFSVTNTECMWQCNLQREIYRVILLTIWRLGRSYSLLALFWWYPDTSKPWLKTKRQTIQLLERGMELLNNNSPVLEWSQTLLRAGSYSRLKSIHVTPVPTTQAPLPHWEPSHNVSFAKIQPYSNDRVNKSKNHEMKDG